MKSRVFCLRAASFVLAVFALWQIARLWAGIDWVILHYRPSLVVNLASIVVAGVLSIALIKRSGPWSKSVPLEDPDGP